MWSIGRGAFNPVISDGRTAVLPGLLEPLHAVVAELRPKRDDRSPRPARGERRAQGAARAKRKADKRRAQAERVRKRKVARRVAARRAQFVASSRLRRQHRKICFTSHGHPCLPDPRPLVCVKQKNGRTVCRAAEGLVVGVGRGGGQEGAQTRTGAFEGEAPLAAQTPARSRARCVGP